MFFRLWFFYHAQPPLMKSGERERERGREGEMDREREKKKKQRIRHVRPLVLLCGEPGSQEDVVGVQEENTKQERPDRLRSFVSKWLLVADGKHDGCPLNPACTDLMFALQFVFAGGYVFLCVSLARNRADLGTLRSRRV